MPMIEEFEATGNWLFRWRSYAPLVLLLLSFAALKDYQYPLQSAFAHQIWEVFCLLIAFLGLGVRALTIGYTPKNTSGRNRSKQVADTLNTKGMYAVVRNPLYLGNFISWLGISLFWGIWWVAVIYALSFALYYERIIFAEEMFLRQKFGQSYLDWAAQTPAFLPRVRQWQAPEISFSFRNVLKREYHGFFAIILTMFVLELIGEFSLGHGFHVGTFWKCLLAFGLVVYVTLRFLRKHTSLLKVTGR